jgi:ABC-type transport system involved in cytochrome c biogenesis permease subunit
VFLGEHRRLKRKRRMPGQLPSLEALDRANRAALALGFPLLTLGVVSGVLWVQSSGGALLAGDPHQTASLIAWGIYAVLVVARFGARQGSRQAAVSAVAGFAFLFCAAVGLELFL